jgi:carbon-monoxide dehydrogenase medium subunit
MPKLYNLREYHRPTNIDEALKLLHRKNIRTVALAGGTNTVGEATPDIEAVVDLDGLGLDFIEHKDGALVMGAMLRLQTVVEKLHDVADGLLANAARRTAGWHVRNAATVGGVLASRDIHSPLSVALAALNARVKIYGQTGEMALWSELSSQIDDKGLKGKLITAVSLSLPAGPLGAAYEQVARTTADRPIVCAASVARQTGDGGLDVTTVIGGLVHQLVVINHRGKLSKPDQARDSLLDQLDRRHSPETAYFSDFLGSAEYRRGVAPLLAHRALETALSRLPASSHK